MGRIKTQLIKRVTHKLLHAHGDKFTEDFNKNKELVSQYLSVNSKKLRNIIAGYATRLIKKGKEEDTGYHSSMNPNHEDFVEEF